MRTYANVQVMSHPRSGSHYLAALIAANFFDTSNYVQFYGGHRWGEAAEQLVQSHANTLFVYTYRVFENVAKSVWVMRRRFGLQAESFEQFLTTRYCDMWTANQGAGVLAKRSTLVDETEVIQVDSLFRRVMDVPSTFHQRHVDSWLNLAACNVGTISYDKLLLDYKEELKKLMPYFDFQPATFVNIDKKVGWTAA